jgi:hypothetical protein
LQIRSASNLRAERHSDFPEEHGQQPTSRRGAQVYDALRRAISISEQVGSKAARTLFDTVRHPAIVPPHPRTEPAMPPLATFNVLERRREKERARQADLARIEQGLDTPAEVRDRNGLFSALDPSRARVVLGRRRRIVLDF